MQNATDDKGAEQTEEALMTGEEAGNSLIFSFSHILLAGVHL